MVARENARTVRVVEAAGNGKATTSARRGRKSTAKSSVVGSDPADPRLAKRVRRPAGNKMAAVG